MRFPSTPFIRFIYSSMILLGVAVMLSSCGTGSTEADADQSAADQATAFENIYWNVIAILPDGQTLDIQAFDSQGNAFDIKAIQNSDQDSFLDVKAMGGGKELPVKMLVSEDHFAPVKAIDKEGSAYDLKAVTAEGERMEVKGVLRIGYIVLMKAISAKGEYYAVKAISPAGQLNDIKGIKINHQEREMSLNGMSIHAHVKAMHPAEDEEAFKVPPKPRVKKPYTDDFERIIWNVKAVTPEGKNLNVKAFDEEGNTFDVKATQDSKQHSFMSVKVIVEGYELPVKVLDSEGDLAPVNAIGPDGTLYDIKAMTEDGRTMDIKGIGRSGNIIHVKAIDENGDFYGVKAFSSDGKLNDVKGIKIFDMKVEQISKGNSIQAHLKAISQ